MRKVWAIIRREFVEKVRSKWFIISTVLGPVFIIVLMVLPSMLATRSGGVNNIVMVSAGSDSLAERVGAMLGRTGRFNVTQLAVAEDRQVVVTESLTTLVQGRALDGFLILTAASTQAGSAEYRGRNVSSLRDMSTLEGAVRQAIVVERLGEMGVDPSVVQEAQRRVDVRTLRISRRGATGESGEMTFFLGYFVGLMLYMIILIYGINVMRSVLEEKQSRIIEVLVSSLRPFQLMLGKVVGVGSVGLFQFAIWGLFGYGIVSYRTRILAAFNVPPDAMDAVRLPHIQPELLGVVVVYFLLGYLLYSAMFAAVGASVTSDSEAQQAQQPVMMLLVFSLIISFSALADAGGRLAVITSMIPFSAPIIMPVRVATGDVPFSELALSLAITAASCLLVLWLAGRIYRIGILMYGKRPSLKEMFRWARQS